MSIDLLRIDPDRFTDWTALHALIMNAFAYMDGRIDPPSSAHRLTPENLREKASVEIGIVAIEDGQLLGCVFCKAEPETLYIGKFAISPKAQGKGLGRLLLTATENLARELGLGTLRLETRIELTDNHAVFGKWGFVKTAENAHAGYDRPTSIEMKKTL